MMPRFFIYSSISRIRSVFGSSRIYSGNFLFILGSGRSGNTLLRRLVCEKYNIYIPAETYSIGDALSSFNKTPHLIWPQRVRLVLSNFEYQGEFSRISSRGLFPVFEDCMRLPELERTFGNILERMWSFFAQGAKFDYDIPGDKTPYNMASINMIARAFPHGSYLFISRHPYDVCVSYVKMGRYTDLQSAARRWTMAHENWTRLMNRSPKLKAKLMRYEDLVRNPDREVSDVGTWLGIREREVQLGQNVFWGDMDAYAHISDAKSDVNTDSIGKGARTLSQKDKDIIKDIVRDMSIRFGYEL